MQPANKTLFKKFSEDYTYKALFLFFLILLLHIPMWMVGGIIKERKNTANSAEEDIMKACGGELMAAGPVIAIPGIRTERVRKDDGRVETVQTHFTFTVAPQELNIGANFKTELKKRGIFSVPMFYGGLSIIGTFDLAPALASLQPNEDLFSDAAELILALSSQKGIRKIDRAVWNADGRADTDLFFQPGNQGHDFASSTRAGIYAALPEFTEKTKANFNMEITIQGGRLVRFLPVGRETHVEIAADWPAPLFQGSFLPAASSVRDDGFNAAWDVSYLSRDIPLYWKPGIRDYSDVMFGVDFFRAIDTYSLNTRAVKYAVLFLLVPFLTLFLFEVLTKQRIHPVPYLLSGIANIIFYLLLLSLSEQMEFYVAYVIAALAIIVMLTLYSRALLPSWGKSWYMGLVTAISYGLLYGVLNAESYALLIGSVWAFIVVALVMFLTRKLNWYGSDEG